MPVVHIIGNVKGGFGFGETRSVFTKWHIQSSHHNVVPTKQKQAQQTTNQETNSATTSTSTTTASANKEVTSWQVIDGDHAGRTWIAERQEQGDMAIWNDPIDVAFSTASISGWPQITFQVYTVDEYKRTDIIGYGSCYVPSSPGEHKVTVACFRPKGTTLEEIQAYFLGGTPTYDDVRLVGQGDSRFMHPTVSTGSVVVELSVVMKQFHKHVSLAAEDLDKYVNESVCDTCRPTKNGATLAAMQDEVDREDFVNTMMHGEGNDTLLDDTRMSISKSYLR